MLGSLGKGWVAQPLPHCQIVCLNIFAPQKSIRIPWPITIFLSKLYASFIQMHSLSCHVVIVDILICGALSLQARNPSLRSNRGAVFYLHFTIH